jgi:hypothetical protein
MYPKEIKKTFFAFWNLFYLRKFVFTISSFNKEFSNFRLSFFLSIKKLQSLNSRISQKRIDHHLSFEGQIIINEIQVMTLKYLKLKFTSYLLYSVKTFYLVGNSL